ncbi:N-alpha-acetyltransferase MAK3-like protein [Drosera capensis]
MSEAYQCGKFEFQIDITQNTSLTRIDVVYPAYPYPIRIGHTYGLFHGVSMLQRAFHRDRCVGTVVCKMGEHRGTFRGYIAMLVVIEPYRGKGIATELVSRSIRVMMESGCEEVTLEAEVTNKGALALYAGLGFIRAKRLFRYYLNGVDAFRLKLSLPRAVSMGANRELHNSQVPP